MAACHVTQGNSRQACAVKIVQAVPAERLCSAPTESCNGDHTNHVERYELLLSEFHLEDDSAGANRRCVLLTSSPIKTEVAVGAVQRCECAPPRSRSVVPVQWSVTFKWWYVPCVDTLNKVESSTPFSSLRSFYCTCPVCARYPSKGSMLKGLTLGRYKSNSKWVFLKWFLLVVRWQHIDWNLELYWRQMFPTAIQYN